MDLACNTTAEIPVFANVCRKCHFKMFGRRSTSAAR